MCNARYLVAATITRTPEGAVESWKAKDPTDIKCHACGNDTLVIHDWGVFPLKPGVEPPTPGHPLCLAEPEPG